MAEVTALELLRGLYDYHRWANHRLAVGGLEQVLGGEHQPARFLHRLVGERNMHRHLVAVEVGVESRAH